MRKKVITASAARPLRQKHQSISALPASNDSVIPQTQTITKTCSLSAVISPGEGGATQKFTKTFRLWPQWNSYDYAGDLNNVAKFDIIADNRWNSGRTPGGWAAIKAINPNIEIYPYQEGTYTRDDRDLETIEWNNTITRWDLDRGHSMGNLNTDNPNFFLLDAGGNRIRNTVYNQYLLDFSLSDFVSYWLEATNNDIITQSWAADGIFADDCLAIRSNSADSGVPAKYPAWAGWDAAMNEYIQAITVGLHAINQKVICNRLGIGRVDGQTAWIDLDESANPPDGVMEEMAWFSSSGSNITYYNESAWKLEVDLMSQIHNSKVIYNTYSVLGPDDTGTDSDGNAVTMLDVLWYALCSFQLGKNTTDNNSYFGFYCPGQQLNNHWFDEFDIDLGNAVGDYQVTSYDGVNIYFREFTNGFIYVNPTSNPATSISLPTACHQLTHDNLLLADKGELTSNFDIGAHRGKIFLKVC